MESVQIRSFSLDDWTPRERELFEDLDAASQMHPIERDKDGILRFKANRLVRFLLDEYQPGLNDLWQRHGQRYFSRAEMQAVYRDMGYSLGGYHEIWVCNHPADECED